jgi:Ca-activated chloride channel homolog
VFSGQGFLQLLFVFLLTAVTQVFSQTSDPVHITPKIRVEKAPDQPGFPAAKNAGARPIRVDVDIVLVPVTVVDAANHPVTNLEKQNFTLYEADKPQTLRYFSIEDSPISVGVLLDLSFSMTDKIDMARQALKQFFETSNPDDDYFVIGFSDRPALIADTTRSAATIEDELAFAVPSGHTALLDSIYMGLIKLRTARYKRRALVIISDGGDNHSRYTANEIRSLVQEADVEVYALGIFSKVFKTYEEWNGERLLTTISETTGGRTIKINNPEELPGAAEAISRELRNQYILGYSPTNSLQDGRWRKIRVKVVPESAGNMLHVFNKQGYLAPLGR